MDLALISLHDEFPKVCVINNNTPFALINITSCIFPAAYLSLSPTKVPVNPSRSLKIKDAPSRIRKKKLIVIVVGFLNHRKKKKAKTEKTEALLYFFVYILVRSPVLSDVISPTPKPLQDLFSLSPAL